MPAARATRLRLGQASLVECAAALSCDRLGGDEEIHALRGLRSLVHGFAALEMRGALKHPVDREASFAWLIEMFIAGLGAQPKVKRKRLRGRRGV